MQGDYFFCFLFGFNLALYFLKRNGLLVKWRIALKLKVEHSYYRFQNCFHLLCVVHSLHMWKQNIRETIKRYDIQFAVEKV